MRTSKMRLHMIRLIPVRCQMSGVYSIRCRNDKGDTFRDRFTSKDVVVSGLVSE